MNACLRRGAGWTAGGGLLVVLATGCGSAGSAASAPPVPLPAGLCSGLAHALGPDWDARTTSSASPSSTTVTCTGTRSGVELDVTVTRFPDHASAEATTTSLRHDDFAFFRTSYPPAQVEEHPLPQGWAGRLASVVYSPDPSAPTTRLVSTVSDLARGDDAVHVTITGPRTTRAAAPARSAQDGATVVDVGDALADRLDG